MMSDLSAGDFAYQISLQQVMQCISLPTVREESLGTAHKGAANEEPL